MSTNQLPEHFTETYAQSWFHRIQQFPSLLAETVTTDSVDGFQKRYSQLERQDMEEITVRHGTTQRQDATMFIRWLKTKKHNLANVIDEWDDKELGVLISPKGAIIENQGFSYNRRKDRTILDGAEGLATTGEDADVFVPLPASQIVSVSFVPTGGATDSGMTFPKVVRARRIFNDNVLPLNTGMAFAVISPQADEDLVRDVDEARNRDFTQITPIADGTLDGKMWMGFKWIVHTDLTVNLAAVGAGGPVTATQCLFWHKRHVYFGDGEKRSSVDILPENSHGVQCRTRTRMGSLRFEEKGVVMVETLTT